MDPQLEVRPFRMARETEGACSGVKLTGLKYHCAIVSATT